MRNVNACPEAYALAIRQNYIDNKTVDETIEYCRSIGRDDFVEFLEETKKTEHYVRNNGKIIFMVEKYKVFNPTTGQYIEYNDFEAAKQDVVRIATQILADHKLNITQVIRNENGDEAWSPVDINSMIKISI